VRIHPLVALVDQTSQHRVDVALLARALSYQAQYHFQPHWGSSATVTPFSASTPIPPDAWQLVLLDDSDQAGALGYHDWTAAGFPIGKVFVETDHKYGALPSVTASHELLEMLADPDISRCYQTGNARFHALEVGDPVEADADGYQVYGLQMSNFILPTWFGQNGVPSDGRYDRLGQLTAPLSLRAGGYASYWSGGGWHQVDARGRWRPLTDDDSPRWRDRNNRPAA
jgi:hypothetical protein